MAPELARVANRLIQIVGILLNKALAPLFISPVYAFYLHCTAADSWMLRTDPILM